MSGNKTGIPTHYFYNPDTIDRIVCLDVCCCDDLGGTPSPLGHRVDAAIHDLNEDRPRPMLGGRTARDVFEQDRIPLPDRQEFRKEVDRTERQLHDAATTRAERDAARRRAVEHVLLAYGLMKEIGDVSHNFEAAEGTK